jgi:hypothetical protein
MHVIAQGGAPGIQSAEVVLVLAAIGMVVFWKAVVKLVLALVAIAILVAVGSGVLELMHGAHL